MHCEELGSPIRGYDHHHTAVSVVEQFWEGGAHVAREGEGAKMIKVRVNMIQKCSSFLVA